MERNQRLIDEALEKERLESGFWPLWKEFDIRAAMERVDYEEAQRHRADSRDVGGVLVEIVRANGEAAIARLCVSKSGIGAEAQKAYEKDLEYICFNSHAWEHPDIWWPKPGGQEGEGCYANLLGLDSIEQFERTLASICSLRLLYDKKGQEIHNPRVQNFTVIRLDGSRQDIRELVELKYDDEMVTRCEKEARR